MGLVARIAMLMANRFTYFARVQREARALVESGHDVTIHCLAGPGLPDGEHESVGANDLWVVRHREPDWLSLTGPGRLIPLLRWYTRYDFLARAAERTAPDLVVGHDLELLVPAARLAERLGIPHVYDDHELGLEKLGQGIADWVTGAKRAAMNAITAHLRRKGLRLERRYIRRAAGFVTASPLYAKTLHERHGVEPVVLLNVPERTDPEPTPRLRALAGLPPEARVVLYQGTITPSGGAEHAIEAAARFPEGWYLVFLGVTWMRPRLEEHVRAAGLEHRVRFLDAVSPDDLPGWTRAADIGISPIRPTNRGQAYSLANKLFEYLHAGLPMVVSDLPGQGPLIRELEAGEVLPEVSAEAIAAAVGRIATLPDTERRAWGERLRALAHERYCWEIEREKLLALYARVLGR